MGALACHRTASNAQGRPLSTRCLFVGVICVTAAAEGLKGRGQRAQQSKAGSATMLVLKPLLPSPGKDVLSAD